MARRPLDDGEEVEVRDRAALEAWLSAHHGRPRGVWLVTGKRASPDYLPMGEIVRACLAWGWVDSLSRGKDELRSMVWISPRRPGSNWSAVNKAHVAALEAEGRMAPPGAAAVARAKADGTWTALDGVEALEVPPDLAAALDDRGARALWDALPRSVRRGALEQILNARRSETRARTIARVADETARGERPLRWRGR